MTTDVRAPAPSLLSLEEARARILDGVTALPVERVGLRDAHGRVLAAALTSRLTLPPWDNSAMDGFAVRSADVVAASVTAPVVLRVVGEVAAGHMPTVAVQPATALRVLTGAPMPEGADAVVPVEDTDAGEGAADLPSSVAIRQPAASGAHVRRAGSDLQADATLLEGGTVLTPAGLALAAAGGHGDVPVHRRPQVAVLATGDELVAAGTDPRDAQIPDSNSPGLSAQALEAGAEVRELGIAPDSLAAVEERLRGALDWADVIIVSGGVSVGAHDVVKDAFNSVGQMDLWRVAVQPGKPLAFARAPAANRDGRRDVLLFGLPGNPVSSLVTFELFVRPVLRRMAGHADLSGRRVVSARLAEPVTKAAGRRAFLRVRLEPAGGGMADGAWLATLAGGQGSHQLSALAAAHGLAIVSEERDRLPAGSEVEVLLLDERVGR